MLQRALATAGLATSSALATLSNHSGAAELSAAELADADFAAPEALLANPPSLPAGVRYRYQHPRLFQPAPLPYPARIAGALEYVDGRRNGPTSVFVDSFAGWAWTKPGGDWIDLDGIRHGNKPWASVVAASIGTFHLDVTRLVNMPRWTAMLMRCPRAQRQIAGQKSATPPWIEVTYDDNTTARLACWMTASIAGMATIPATLAPAPALPALLEFDRPAKRVQRAILHFNSLSQWASYGGPPVIEVFLLDPPINKEAPTTGVAAAYPLDVGIERAPGVFGAHRYEDGRGWSDFVSALQVNTNDERVFDPALYGTGPENRALLPHRDLGKWITPGPDWKLVNSSYRGDNFLPIAPGRGAMRIHMKASGIQNGGTGGYGGSLAANAHLYLPAERFGRQRRLFVRCGVRITRGEGHVDGPPGRPQVFTVGTQAKWTDDAGKFFPMPSHARTTGGLSGSAGGGMGWQARLGWAYTDSQLGGPDENGWMIYGHYYDFGYANPPGHRYTTDTREKTNFGQRGGLGAMIYFDRWYDIEAEILLNSVDKPAVLADGTPHIINGVRQYWSPDGAWRMWIDGRLAYERTGLVYRTLPVANPGFKPGYSRPCRELGAEGVWLNWFHGGVTQNARARTMFLSNLVWSEQRIGPMRR